MEIKYEIHTISNSQGTGKERVYIQLQTGAPLSARVLERLIEEASSATSGDVKSVMSALCSLAKHELSAGKRFYLPEIGYLSLAVGNVPPEQKRGGRITGKDIYVRGVNFRPEARFLKDIKAAAHFVKSDQSTRSARYEEAELWAKVQEYLSRERYLTRTDLVQQFGLSQYMAGRWLARFVADGRLVKDGTAHYPLYFAATQS